MLLSDLKRVMACDTAIDHVASCPECRLAVLMVARDRGIERFDDSYDGGGYARYGAPTRYGFASSETLNWVLLAVLLISMVLASIAIIKM